MGKGVLEAFLLPTNWSFSVAELTILYKSCFGRRSAGIRVTWPAHLAWAFCSRVWMLGMPARVRTSVSGTMSCNLMLRIIRKHCVWKWLSFQAWRLYTIHDSHAYSRTVSTTAMYTMSLGWFLVGPQFSSWVFQMQSWLGKVCYWLPRQCWLLWRGCFPGRWKNR